jgi:hypothetical protein
VKVLAETPGAARSNLIDRLNGRTKPRRRYHKAQDAALVPLIMALVAVRPTYGYRRSCQWLRHWFERSPATRS